MELFPFQQELVDKFNPPDGDPVPGVLIADDMGLGKTIEALERSRRLYKCNQVLTGQAPTLIVAPLSVLSSWHDHLLTYFGEYLEDYIRVIDPKNRQAFVKAALEGRHDYYICHWEALRLMPELQKVKWFHIIADECHRMKNRKAQQTQALKRLSTKYKTALSGTPADNKPQDLWSTLNWLDRKEWSSYWKFYGRYIEYTIEYPGGYHKQTGVALLPELHQRLEPIYMRRRKQDVLKDLPDKYYTQVWVDLEPKQRRIYDQMRTEMLAWIGEHENEPIAAPVVLSKLTRLQQFACAYAEVEHYKVWEEYKDPETFEVKARPFDKSKLVLTEPSSKLDAVMDLLEDNPDEQFVVFAQSKQLMYLLARRLIRKKIAYGLLTGDTPQANRGPMVEGFQRGQYRVFAGTIRAGGVGITLTMASKVVFLDRAWSPADNQQAEDRLHRIGQKNAVQVIDVMARDTIDLGRHQQIQQKWSWIKQLLGDTDG